VYDKLESMRNVLNATNLKDCEEAFETQKRNNAFVDGIAQIQKEL